MTRAGATTTRSKPWSETLRTWAATIKPRRTGAAIVLLLASLTFGPPAPAEIDEGARGRSASDSPARPGGAVQRPGVGGEGGLEAWEDPYPPMPTDNDPAFLGAKWHAGPMVDGNQLEYLAEVPNMDTTGMPVIVISGANDDSLNAHKSLYRRALTVFIGPSPLSGCEEACGEVHNAWLSDKISSAHGPGCSPSCPTWMFVPAAALRDVLTDLAKHVRFGHDRVQMFGYNYTRYDIYRALDPILQPYFAGVAHGIYAEWQQASCPDAAKPTASPPRIFFSWGGCDQSFCPTMECMNTLRSYGYAIDPSSGGATTLESCPCPEVGWRAHWLGTRVETQEGTYKWLLSNVRK